MRSIVTAHVYSHETATFFHVLFHDIDLSDQIKSLLNVLVHLYFYYYKTHCVLSWRQNVLVLCCGHLLFKAAKNEDGCVWHYVYFGLQHIHNILNLYIVYTL